MAFLPFEITEPHDVVFQAEHNMNARPERAVFYWDKAVTDGLLGHEPEADFAFFRFSRF